MSDLLSRLLSALQPWRQAPAWRIALSGGLDSSVLLHLLASLARRHALPPLSAIHVHHGLQAVADSWPAHCQRLCAQLGVPLQIEYVQVAGGASIERAAREARYAAFRQITQAGEVLLLAQHRDDQAETLLFRLLRGAGVRGLAAMPRQRELGQGVLLRPLLDVPRAELEAYAQAHELGWIEDPSNTDMQLSRNFLRHQALPLLARYWPQASANLARTAEHLREAQQLLDELAQADLATVAAPSEFAWLGLPSLALEQLRELSPARQRNALRHWLAPLTELPNSDHWAGWGDLRDAQSDRAPIWRLARGELHRADGRLWWLGGEWLQPVSEPVMWVDLALPLALPGNGRLHLQGQLPDSVVQVRYRQGGEVMVLPQRGHRDLKRLLNERRIPAFVRARLPLLYVDDQLLAVANLPGLDGVQVGEWQLRWSPPTNDQGLS
ncbi:tRNA lysidine(34) synthetase TilS [Pseudomonas sp. PDM14]|uniref:tRNA lysidine(34) synthetase TilS n=1 Tax=Pseudomonas sp. PDM14 TaxID=2769288 RepID=UPI001785EF27|nr:tRNA lysidine(34) synthetase TilS [Pseudomonas sp. PDM14]MBD9485003.1 tRNA lysidine(34) synthetase TilS [Pseudomonas sp. PDM14]